ncbi:sensor histidine kinase [Arenibaculum pallidiluteum]|uniref:sensor histidine kinase n=1 Tax=Arenibaculum pallidiluteum TaxID=2812559 RepID=UPI001A9790D7|nr:PAS-domain containing protein [Arenibaculum pallidiluteum]
MGASSGEDQVPTRFGALLDGLPDPTFVLDVRSGSARVVYANPAGRSLSDDLEPALHEPSLARAIQAGRSARVPLRLMLEASVAPLEEPGIALVVLRQAGPDALVREVIESIGEGFTLWDRHDRLVLYNSRYVELFAVGADMIRPGVRFVDLLNVMVSRGAYRVADRDAFIRRRMASRQARETRLEVAMAHGRVYRVVEQRTPSGMLVTVWVDVTELNQAEQRLRDAIDSVTEAFSLWDSSGRLVLCNRRFADLVPSGGEPLEGIGFEEALRRGAKAGIYRVDGDIDAWVHGRTALFRHGGSFEQPVADGRWLLSGYRRTSEGGVVGIETDVSLIKRQELALSELAERYMAARDSAEEASRARSQFLALMSHELRTPLNAIIGFSELIETQALGPIGVERYVEYARDVRLSGSHLLALVNDLLDMSKIEAGKYELHRDVVDLRQIVRSCVRMMALRAQEADVMLVDRLDEIRMPPLNADERALKQVILNLLSNALKFTEAGGRTEISGAVLGGWVEIRVEDDGIGIPPEHLTRIGRPFEQVDNAHTRRHAGTGLGLALSRSLVELHGGYLDIDSAQGRGTCVTVRLPALSETACQPARV